MVFVNDKVGKETDQKCSLSLVLCCYMVACMCMTVITDESKVIHSFPIVLAGCISTATGLQAALKEPHV